MPLHHNLELRMQVVNDTGPFIKIERGKEDKLTTLASLFESLRNGWMIIPGQMYMSDDSVGVNLREPTKFESERISRTMEKYCRSEDL